MHYRLSCGMKCSVCLRVSNQHILCFDVDVFKLCTEDEIHLHAKTHLFYVYGLVGTLVTYYSYEDDG